MFRLFLLAALAAAGVTADVTGCACDPALPGSMERRECGLCREADKHPEAVEFFFLKDNNPRKPSRWLLLPKAHTPGPHSLASLTQKQRTAMWSAAIEKARSLWGEDWGLAFNGDKVRTQCHAHVHIGKLLKGVETGRFIVVRGPSEIPLPKDGTGLWIHPRGARLHVHLGEQICETVLFR